MNTVLGIEYDLNGNIQALERNGFVSPNVFGLIDKLSYTYKNNSNILESVSEDGEGVGTAAKGFTEINTNGIDYAYDANGNMTSDYNKGVTVTYNHMNLPVQALLSNQRTITWTYDAAGVKLTKKVTQGSTIILVKEYVGGIEYIKNGNAYTVEAIYHREGRLTTKGGIYQFEYTLKDHLGNARVSFADLDNDGKVDQSEILQTNHYYPFGLRHEGNDLPQQGITNAYQYNGKELNTDFGLDWLDYGARWYDASIARWSAVDPLAEKYAAFSPYNYVLNNPLIFIDPDGRSVIIGGKIDEAKLDIKSFVPKDYHDKITFVNNEVSLNMTKEEVYETGDLGLIMLYEMVHHDDVFAWEVYDDGTSHDYLFKSGTTIIETNLTISSESETEEVIAYTKEGNHNLVNKPIKKKYPIKKDGKIVKNRITGKTKYKEYPVDNFVETGYMIPGNTDVDIGRRIIDHSYQFYEKDPKTNNVIKKDRASIVFHEFGEMYHQRIGGLPYWKDAHPASKKDEHNLPNGDQRKSKNPGEIDTSIYKKEVRE